MIIILERDFFFIASVLNQDTHTVKTKTKNTVSFIRQDQKLRAQIRENPIFRQQTDHSLKNDDTSDI